MTKRHFVNLIPNYEFISEEVLVKFATNCEPILLYLSNNENQLVGLRVADMIFDDELHEDVVVAVEFEAESYANSFKLSFDAHYENYIFDAMWQSQDEVRRDKPRMLQEVRLALFRANFKREMHKQPKQN